MRGLDLFSGVGGLSLALAPWVRTVAYCESDRYAQAVLLSRMREGSLDLAPIWDDVRTLDAASLPPIDIIFGGFPCQDISAAGLGKGLAGERSGLFFEIARLTDVLRPAFVFLENVPAITSRGLDRVIGTFSELRYDCRWTVVSAAELGAPHLRKRWFLLAADADRVGVRDEQQWAERGWLDLHPQGEALALLDGPKESVAHALRERLEVDKKCDRQESQGEGESRSHADRFCDHVADANGGRCQQCDESLGEFPKSDESGPTLANANGLGREWIGIAEPSGFEGSCGRESDGCGEVREFEHAAHEIPDSEGGGLAVRGGASWEGRYSLRSDLQAQGWIDRRSWAVEPDVGRVAHGVPARVDRLRCLGNAVVPIQARTAFTRLIGIEG